MQLFNEDKVSNVPISLVMLLQAWGEDGSMEISSELAVTLADNDKVALLTQLDQLAGVSQILGEMSDEPPENIWSGKSLELRTLSIALPVVLKVFNCQKTVNAVTNSDEARRDFIKEEAATQYADFYVELQSLEHQCSKGEDLKISAQPILASLKSFNEYMKGILTSYLRAMIVPLNNTVDEVSTRSNIDLKPILSSLTSKHQELMTINKLSLIHI